MLFNIKIVDLSHFKQDKKNPYVIRYELVPDISKGVQNVFYHQSKFSNFRKAQRVADDLSSLFADCYCYLDMVYLKLKQLELVENQTHKYLQFDFNSLEAARVVLLKNRVQTLEAWKHIQAFDEFIQLLKKLCFNINKDFYSAANQIFQQLVSFEEHFKNLYRSSEILSEKKQLRLFL